MRQLKHKDKIRFIVETEHFEKGFETQVKEVLSDGVSFGFETWSGIKMICGEHAFIQYLHGEHWEFVD